MFGHPDDNGAQQQGTPNPPAPDGGLGDNNDSTAGMQGAPQAPQAPHQADDAGSYIMSDAPQGADSNNGGGHDQAMDELVGEDTPEPAHTDDLLDIKQQALQQLSPLVGHLEQTPEEEFRTTMMMIQAADDQSLIPKAYDAAQKIADEKTKARALLDVVNEINYFTQHHHKDDGAEADQTDEHQQ